MRVPRIILARDCRGLLKPSCSRIKGIPGDYENRDPSDESEPRFDFVVHASNSLSTRLRSRCVHHRGKISQSLQRSLPQLRSGLLTTRQVAYRLTK